MSENIDGYCSKCGEAIAVDPKTNRGYCPYCQDEKTPLEPEDLSEFMANLYGFYWVDEEKTKE